MAVPIRKVEPGPKEKTKVVQANQKALDNLPLNSGMWRVSGCPGLYIRCRATSKSFIQQRRVDGVLVKETFGQLTMKAAKALAHDRWGSIQPAAEGDAIQLGAAVEAYIKHRTLMGKMAPSTAGLAKYNLEHYLDAWKHRTLDAIGRDRPGIAALHTRLTDKHGKAKCNQIVRLLAAVYRWHRDRFHEALPEWPRKLCEIHTIAPRDWALGPAELQEWWRAVSTLSPVKKMWWTAALLTGGRAGSIEALKWENLDLDKKTCRFAVAKGGKAYTIPMSDLLTDLLRDYRDSGQIAPDEVWVFPSPKAGAHLGHVKNEGVRSPHALRHTYRTSLAQLGCSSDHARLLLGHSMGGDVSRDYISSALVVESLRPITNKVAELYLGIVDLKS